ncbi:MAG: phosphosulfolactate synthase [Phycisphaeraceae bacterium]
MPNPTAAARPFPSIEHRDRPAKPREQGITMLIDWGMGPQQQRDLLRVGGAHLDLAKIAVGTSALMPTDVLREKLEAYEQAQVRPFPGGQYLEYAVHLDKLDTYLAEAADAGYKLIEVSDNTVPFDAQFKRDAIRRAIERYGLDVLGEVGSKVSTTDVPALVADLQGCLDAGAWKVFVEAAEFFDESGLRGDLLDALVRDVPAEAMIFELPGTWLGPSAADRLDLIKALLARLGPEVNLANIEPWEVLFVESLRCRIGVAGFE